MSKLGKIFLWIALVGLLVSMAAGYLLITKFNDTKATLVQTSDARDRANAEAAKEKKLAEDTALAKAETEAKLTAANSNIDKLNSQLADKANSALTQATQAADKAKADLAAINATLGNQTAADLVAAKTQAEANLAAAQSDEKIMKDQHDKDTQQIADLTADINRVKNNQGEPPGVSGKITFVNRTWNFVVLNVGLANGVVPNGELIVFRNNTFLGKIKVTSVEANSAVADILPSVKGDIQVGDYVLN